MTESSPPRNLEPEDELQTGEPTNLDLNLPTNASDSREADNSRQYFEDSVYAATIKVLKLVPKLQQALLQSQSNANDTHEGFFTPNPPTILRTVYRQPLKGLMAHPTYDRDLEEEAYDNYRDSATGSAIELKKDVRVIPPQNLAAGRQGVNKGQDIIDHVVSEKMTIRSPDLIRVIKEVVSYWPSAAYYDNQTKLELNKPYRSLCVYRDAFKQKLDQYQSQFQRLLVDEKTGEDGKNLKKVIEELGLMLGEVDKVQEEPIKQEERRHRGDEKYQIPPKATFEMLWMLYKPGTEVYVNTNDFEGVCRVKLLVWDRGPRFDVDTEDPYASVELHLWYLDHEGTHIGRRQHTQRIERFQGERRIDDLPVYPTKFKADWNAFREKLVASGKRYRESIQNGFSHCVYDGPISRHKSSPHVKHLHTGYHGKVIVDPGYYYIERGPIEEAVWLEDSNLWYSGRSKPDNGKVSKLDPAKASEFENDDYVLLPKWIRGFTIGTRGVRDWAWLNMDERFLRPYKHDHSLIGTVAFSNESDLIHIKAMTFRPYHDAQHQSLDHILQADYIEEKGEGRVILLHGPPGLGKTYTVECIAEYSDRPLLRLTCAELGLDPTELEKNLNIQLRRAERWGSIVLIDEADIFLGTRNKFSTLDREAIVAVFLRALEYYSGILFLTTNRATAFDPAVLDRMTLVVQYKRPDDKIRGRIRNNCLARIEKSNRFELTAKAVVAFAKIDNDEYSWSGREIVSVVKHAAVLAEWRSTEFTGTATRKIEIDENNVQSAIDKVHLNEAYLVGSSSKKDKKGRQIEVGQV